MNQNNNQQSPQPVVNWPLLVINCGAVPLELVMHKVRTFGIRSIAPRAGGAVLLMWIFVVFHHDENCIPLLCYAGLVVLLSIIAQISALVRYWHGERIHTKYDGEPYLAWVLPRWNEQTIKRLEPFLAIFAGCVIHHFNHGLGSFVITAAICQGIRVGSEYYGKRTSSMDMNDAIIEQTMAAQEFRGIRRR
jgi:hypothetical protein